MITCVFISQTFVCDLFAVSQVNSDSQMSVCDLFAVSQVNSDSQMSVCDLFAVSQVNSDSQMSVYDLIAVSQVSSTSQMSVCDLFAVSQVNSTVPPLTPGTTQKLSQALVDIFQSFEVEQRQLDIAKGQSGFISPPRCCTHLASLPAGKGVSYVSLGETG